MNELLAGAITGFLFGFVMQSAGNPLRPAAWGDALRDMTIVKFMPTTILVAMVGIYLLYDFALLNFPSNR